MTERDLAETSTELEIPTPVAALDYAARDDEPWRIIVNVLSLAAGVLGTTRLLSFAGYVGFTLPDGIWPVTIANAVGVFAQVVEASSALALVIAAVGCISRRKGARLMMIGASIGTAIGLVLRAVGLAWLLLSPLRAMPLMRHRFELLMALPRFIAGLILPALLIWVMTRAPVRKLFESRA